MTEPLYVSWAITGRGVFEGGNASTVKVVPIILVLPQQRQQRAILTREFGMEHSLLLGCQYSTPLCTRLLML